MTTDPTATDLAALKKDMLARPADGWFQTTIHNLIAAVEALREQLGEAAAMEAEARVAVLAGALADIIRRFELCMLVSGTDKEFARIATANARVTLATTPAQAMERAGAVEKVIDACRKFKRLVEAGQILKAVTRCEAALDELDALSKAEP